MVSDVLHDAVISIKSYLDNGMYGEPGDPIHDEINGLAKRMDAARVELDSAGWKETCERLANNWNADRRSRVLSLLANIDVKLSAIRNLATETLDDQILLGTVELLDHANELLMEAEDKIRTADRC
jgi:hypothetical protein